MLFRKKMERCCQYCTYSTALDEGTVLCSKKGIRECSGKCFKFRYDPCKRIPAKQRALNFAQYEEYDYSL